MKLALAASALLAASAAAASSYAATAWPYRAERSGDRLEYVYDLSAIKTGALVPDAWAETTQEELGAFLSALPREVRVAVRLDRAALALSAPGELERAPLSASFSKVSDRELVTGAVVGRPPPARAVPPLHADWPKLLPSVDLVLWKVRAMEDGALAAIELAAESGALGLPMGRRELWAKVLDRAMERYHAGLGDARDGALLLAARVAVASACLEEGRLPGAVRASAPLLEAARVELAYFGSHPGLTPRAPYDWSRELRCLFVRDQVLGATMPNSRAGTAAALTLLAMLEADPKLAKGYAGLKELREAVHGGPGDDVLARYQVIAGEGGARGALEDLGGFLEKLQVALGLSEVAPRPALFARAETPVTRFIDGLRGAERAQAMDELAIAIHDGRVTAGEEGKVPWSSARLLALSGLLRPEAEGGLSQRASVDGSYRSRLTGLFHALQGAHLELEEGGDDESETESGRFELKVRLQVPPFLEVEPLPGVFAQAAGSLRRLGAMLETFPRAAQLPLLSPEGRRAERVKSEAERLGAILRGLELLSGSGVADGAEDRKALTAAKAFLGNWRKDADARSDVRALHPPLVPVEEPWVAGVFGVGRRELRVGFGAAPAVEVLGEQRSLFAANAKAEQRYLLPVLATGSAISRRGQSMDRPRFRALCEKAGRRREAIESSLVEGIAADSPR